VASVWAYGDQHRYESYGRQHLLLANHLQPLTGKMELGCPVSGKCLRTSHV